MMLVKYGNECTVAADEELTEIGDLLTYMVIQNENFQEFCSFHSGTLFSKLFLPPGQGCGLVLFDLIH